MGFGVSGFQFEVSAFGFLLHLLDTMLQVGFRVPGLEFGVQDSGFWVSILGYSRPGFVARRPLGAHLGFQEGIAPSAASLSLRRTLRV